MLTVACLNRATSDGRIGVLSDEFNNFARMLSMIGLAFQILSVANHPANVQVDT